MPLKVRNTASLVHRGWMWWVAELQGLIPPFWLSGEVSDKSAVSLFLDRWTLSFIEGGGVKTIIARVNDDAESVGIHAENDIESIVTPYRGKAAVILLDPSLSLSCRHLIPQMDEEDAISAAHLALPRNFPLSPDQLLPTFRLSSEKADERIKVTTTVVRKNAVDSVLNFARSLHLTPISVRIASGNADLAMEFRADSAKAHRSRARRSFAFLSVAPIAVLALAIIILGQRLDTEIKRTTVELQSAKTNAAAFAQKRNELREMASRVELLRATAAAPNLPQVLDELSRLIPEGNWVRELRFRRGRVTLIGETQDLAPVIPVLEESGLFRSVELVSLNQSATDGVDSFEVELVLNMGEGGL